MRCPWAWLTAVVAVTACSAQSQEEPLFQPNEETGGTRSSSGGATGGSAPAAGGTSTGSGGTNTVTGGSSAGGTSSSGGGTASGATGGSGTDHCGNGALDDGEECDDGGQMSGDGCNPDCKVSCADFPNTKAFTLPDGRKHCYWLLEDWLTWSQAVDACDDAGGHLVTILSKEEDDFVYSLWQGLMWLGSTDGLAANVSGAGTHRWITDEPFIYDSFSPGEPNGICECGNGCCHHCGARVEDASWRDRSCETDYYRVLCEYSAPGN